MDPKPYTKTLQDELDWKLLDQLYGVVAQISSFCFETKKFCVTTEFIVLTLVVKFTNDRLNIAVFVTALVIPLCFWFLDATGYFYQVKLRGTMESIRARVSKRDDPSIVETDGTMLRDGGSSKGAGGAHVISPERASAPTYRRVVQSAFNHSMWLYFLLIWVDLATWLLFRMHKIA
jgi:hypothetical protein